ncbi:hypothetical protein KBC04_04420 [Candidatus Babeliales bacterium]|nr:hypothetical protein [Candidatus Babeliales bacterium]MBP9844311.1 hypothetical protein [Candidatus Babeliales bacterium]
MPYFITIQYPYQYLTINLSDNQRILAEKTVTKFQAVGLLIPTIKQILQEHNLTLSDIACIGINAGPGPFNTLRSIIATANSINFAQHTPLVACNGLDLILEGAQQNTVAILDAFSNDIYFAIKQSGKQGYASIESLINDLNLLYKHETIHFIGNGALKHKDFIAEHFTGIAQFHDDMLFASSQALIDETVRKYTTGLTTTEIFPLYFESPVVKS